MCVTGVTPLAARSSAEYLRQLSMSQRSNGVFINDPKGLFILRWYREVKGDGTPPDGPRYQNRACKYYKLTSDNDGEAFRWTSNYQIISKVYLKKHSTLPLCYSLSAADKKMCADVHHEKDGGTGGRVEARVCMCSRVLLVSS